LTYKIYVFLDNNNKPYYVGRTNNFFRRKSEHLDEIRRGNNLPKYQKARKLLRFGHRFRMKAIATVNSLNESMRLEKFYIRKYRNLGYTMYNLTSGGDDKVRININYKPDIRRVGKKRFRRR